MTTELREDSLVRDEILYLPVALIDPDPAQPRLAVDAELADSIAQHGILQPIQVRPHPEVEGRWMIVDGERRYRGALAAKVKTIPAQITLEVEDVGDRLVRQIVRNEGKPLTPVEEAKAFKRIIDQRHAAGDKHYGVVHLAKELGIAKSTVSDRLALTDIPAFWLELMVTGPLQPSHAPLLRRWAKVPEKYQLKALEQIKADYRWPGAAGFSKGKKGERIYGEVLETLLRTFMTKFIKPVSEVAGYDGPTERGDFGAYGGAKVYAMDPSKWQPIHRKKIAEKRSKTIADVKSGKKEPATPRWVTAAVDAGAKLVNGSWRDWDHKKGESKLGEQSGFRPFAWWYGHHNERKVFDPSVLLRELDPSKTAIYRCESYNGAEFVLVATDNAALGQARSAFLGARADTVREILEDVGRELLVAAEKAGRDELLMGGAAPHVIAAFLATSGHTVAPMLLSLAIAAQCDGAAEVPDKGGAVVKYLTTLKQEPAETLLNAIAAITRDKIKAPPERLETWEKAQLEAFAKVKPTFGAAADDQVEDDAPDPAAKKVTPRRRKNAVDEEALNAEATGEQLDEDPDESGLQCVFCKCTEFNACETDEGPCSWVCDNPAVCSNPECVERLKLEFPKEAEDAGLVEDDDEGFDPPQPDENDFDDIDDEMLGIEEPEPAHAGTPAEG